MAETIKGINVQIGSDTTGLSKALADVNSKSKGIQSELKKVEQALKFNPKNTELLAQKQKLLGDQVAVTKEKLDRLKAAQSQVNEQFKQGKIGEDQYRAFQREVITTGSKLKTFEAQLKNTGNRAKEFAEKLKKTKENLGHIGKTLSTNLTAPLLGAGAALTVMATKAGQATDRIDKMSQRLGLSRAAFQEWDFILSQNGVSIDSMQMGMKSLSQRMDEVMRGTGQGTELFGRLDKSLINSIQSGESQEEVFKKTVIALQNMDDGITKAALAQKLFGRNGQELLPMLNSSKGSVEELMTKARELGLVLNDETINAGVDFTDTLDQLKRALGAAATEVGVALMPAFKSLIPIIKENLVPAVRSFADRIKSLIEWFSNLNPGLQKTIMILTGIAVAIGPVVTAIAAIASPIGLVTLAVTTLAGACLYFATAGSRATAANKELLTKQDALLTNLYPLVGEYQELTKKVNKTNEEKAKLLVLTNKIADAVPGAVTAYDKEGNALLDFNAVLAQTVNLERERLKTRAVALTDQIKQAEKSKQIAENEKIMRDEQWTITQQRLKEWNVSEQVRQKRTKELAAEYTSANAKVVNEINKTTHSLNDLKTEQKAIGKLSDNLTVGYVKNKITEANAAKSSAKDTVTTIKIMTDAEDQANKERKKADEDAAKERLNNEKEWHEKLLNETRTELEKINAEEKKALSEANLTDKAKADITKYYELKRTELAKTEAEKRANLEKEEAQKQRDLISLYNEVKTAAKDRAAAVSTETGGIGLEGSAKELYDLESQYKETTDNITRYYEDMTAKFAGLSQEQKDQHIKAWTDAKVNFEQIGKDEVNFSKQVAAEKLDAEKQYAADKKKILDATKRYNEQLDTAYKDGNIKKYAEILNAKRENGKKTQAELAQELAGNQEMINAYYDVWKEVHRSSMSYMAEAMQTTFSGLSDFFSDIISGTESFSDAWSNLKDTLIKMLADMAAKWVASRLIMAVFGKTIETTMAAASIATAAIVAAAWAPAAAMVSLASFGANSVPAMAGMTSANALAKALSVIPALAAGGVATRPTMALIGEGKSNEAVLPLNQDTYAALGKSIAENMGDNGSSGLTVNLYAGTVIGDKAGMKKLAREIFGYEYSIKKRLGVATR